MEDDVFVGEGIGNGGRCISGRGYWRWRKTYFWERVLEVEEDVFVGVGIRGGERLICGRGYWRWRKTFVTEGIGGGGRGGIVELL